MEKRIGKCKECGEKDSWINQNGVCGYCHIHKIDAYIQHKELKEKGIIE